MKVGGERERDRERGEGDFKDTNYIFNHRFFTRNKQHCHREEREKERDYSMV